MRPLAFSPDSLRKLLLHDKIATLPDLKRALGTDVDLTVFRKLKELDYVTSYSHGGASTLFGRSPVSAPMACGPARRPGSLATAPCWPPPRRSSVARWPDILRKNCRRSCMWGCKMPCAILSSRSGSPGSWSPACSFILPPIQPSASDNL